jgi:peptide methionine sulfoxide reductase MsrA
MSETENQDAGATPRREVATLGGGCFWCTEAVFDELKGVERVESGYSGGKTVNPTSMRSVRERPATRRSCA